MLASVPFINQTKEKLCRLLEMDRDHLVIWVPVFFACGIGLYFSLDYEPHRLWSWAAFSLTTGLALYLMPYKERFYLFWLLIMAFMCLSAGIFIAQMRADRLHTPLLKRDLNGVALEATVKQIDFLEQGKGLRLLLRDIKVLNRDSPPALNLVRLTVRKAPPSVEVGDRVLLRASLFPPAAPVMPGGYDFQRHAYFQGISAYGFSYGEFSVVGSAKQKGFFSLMEDWRTRVSHIVTDTLDARIAPIAIALLTGERTAIGDDDWQALRNSGLAHLLAISGLNVDMTAGIVFFLIRFILSLVPWIALRFPIKKIAAACALLAACFYVAFIVPSVPSQRSLLMAAIVLLAVMLDRSAISMRLLAITALFILMVWPEQLLSPSFQMSFSAVAALIAFYQAYRARLSVLFTAANPILRIFYYAAGVVMTTIIATIATAPISLYHFQSLAVYGVLANALAVPIMTFFIMPIATLCYVLLPLGIYEWALHSMSLGIIWTLDIAHSVASLPGSVFKPASFPSIVFILLMISGVFLVALRGWGRGVCFLPLALCVLLLFFQQSPDIVVAPSGKQFVVRVDNQTLWIASNIHEKRWLKDVKQALGVVEESKVISLHKKNKISQGQKEISCDALSCSYKDNTSTIAFVRHPSAFIEDCSRAQLVFALGFEPKKRNKQCRAIIIGGNDLKYQGTHILIMVTDRGYAFKVDTVSAHRGRRPWVATNR